MGNRKTESIALKLLNGPTGSCGELMGCGAFLNGCDEAQMNCAMLGSNLVSIHSSAENAFVAGELFNLTLSIMPSWSDIDNGMLYVDPPPNPESAAGIAVHRATCIGLKTDVVAPYGPPGAQDISDWYYRDGSTIDFQNWANFDNRGDVMGLPTGPPNAVNEDCAMLVANLYTWSTNPCSWVC